MIPPLLLVAAKAAENSTYKQKLGAVIAKGRRPISKGCNHFRSHRFSLMFPYNHVCHAEVAAVLRAGYPRRRLTGTSIYIARINNTGETRLAKPCEHCQEVLKLVGIQKAVYTTNEGGYSELIF